MNSCTTNRVTLFITLRQLRSVRRQVPGAVFQLLVTVFVLSRLDYCNSVLVGLPRHITNRYQSFKTSLPGLSLESTAQNTGSYAMGGLGVRRPQQPKMYQKGPHCLHIKTTETSIYVLLPGRIPYECRCFLFVTVSHAAIRNCRLIQSCQFTNSSCFITYYIIWSHLYVA